MRYTHGDFRRRNYIYREMEIGDWSEVTCAGIPRGGLSGFGEMETLMREMGNIIYIFGEPFRFRFYDSRERIGL